MERKEIQIFVRRYGDKKNRLLYYRKIKQLSWSEINKITGISIRSLRYWIEKWQGKK